MAKVELGPRSDSVVGKLDGEGSVIYPIYLNTDANALNSVAKCRAVLKEAEKDFPEDMKLTIVQDNTDYVRDSIREVASTFVETLLWFRKSLRDTPGMSLSLDFLTENAVAPKSAPNTPLPR